MRKGVRGAFLLLAFWPFVALCQPAPQFEYAAKLICGVQKGEGVQSTWTLVPGYYETTVNIYNPATGETRISKKVALTYPPGREKPGRIIDLGRYTLGAGVAFQADCKEVMDKLQGPVGIPFIEGFLIIESTSSLDVTGVYTSAGLSAPHSPSIDVEQIRERPIR